MFIYVLGIHMLYTYKCELSSMLFVYSILIAEFLFVFIWGFRCM